MRPSSRSGAMVPAAAFGSFIVRPSFDAWPGASSCTLRTLLGALMGQILFHVLRHPGHGTTQAPLRPLHPGQRLARLAVAPAIVGPFHAAGRRGVALMPLLPAHRPHAP